MTHIVSQSKILAVGLASLTLLAPLGALQAQTKRPGGGAGFGEVTVAADVHHDKSAPLRTMIPAAPANRLKPPNFEFPSRRPVSESKSEPQGDSQARVDGISPELVNGGTGAATTLGIFNAAGVGNYFTGPDGSFTPTVTPSDATGAVGTTQYLQWVDGDFAVFDKATGLATYGPVAGNTLWSGFGGSCQNDNDGQPTVTFDKMAQRWVVSQHAISSGAPYLQCVAVSTTADATGTWYRYAFAISDQNAGWMNLNAKLGVWSDGYYMGFDMYGGSTFEGTKFCALNRAKMLVGAGAGMQCIQLGTEYYSPVISDIDGSVPPPAGAPAYFAADDLGFYALDFFKFHVDWTDSQNTTLGLAILLPEPTYGISCGGPCVEQPNQMLLNPNGSHVLGRMPYRNFGSYQTLLSVENAETITTPLFYEVRITPSGDLYMYQEGELATNSPSWRFSPSIAEDRAGNIAVAYTSSNLETWPGQYVVSRQPGDPVNTLGNETLLNPGNGSQTTPIWNNRSSLTVDPADDCTFYYTQQYQPMDGTNNWSTQIENFTLAGCMVPVTVNTAPAGFLASLTDGATTQSGTQPFTLQLPTGSTMQLSTTSPQGVASGTQWIFTGWSDGGALTHSVPVPAGGGTYTANFVQQFRLSPSASPSIGGTVAPGTAGFYDAGATVNITETPAAGWVFAGWIGNVANPSSGTTSVRMNEAQSVRAVFTPKPTKVTAALTSESGTTAARAWTFLFTDVGLGAAYQLEINSFQLTQTAGVACKPAVVSKLPKVIGNLAPAATINGSVTINFTGCGTDARFSLSLTSSENSGGSSSTLNLTGLTQ